MPITRRAALAAAATAFTAPVRAERAPGRLLFGLSPDCPGSEGGTA